MPLRDHFHAPLDNLLAWENFHAQWPAVIVQHLGKKLPSRYVALPRVYLGSQVEIDIGNSDTEDGESFAAETSEGNGGVATSVWAPAQPTLVVEAELPDDDEYQVRIYDTKRGRRLVAAIEIVSPSNKNRPEHRLDFVSKCAALLRQRVSVVIVDLVTVKDFNLYDELLELLNQSDPSVGAEPPSTYATVCRWRPKGKGRLLEGWNHPLVLSQPLPTLPLWLTDTFAVPLALEESYEQTCKDLRITGPEAERICRRSANVGLDRVDHFRFEACSAHGRLVVEDAVRYTSTTARVGKTLVDKGEEPRCRLPNW